MYSVTPRSLLQKPTGAIRLAVQIAALDHAWKQYEAGLDHKSSLEYKDIKPVYTKESFFDTTIALDHLEVLLQPLGEWYYEPASWQLKADPLPQGVEDQGVIPPTHQAYYAAVIRMREGDRQYPPSDVLKDITLAPHEVGGKPAIPLWRLSLAPFTDALHIWTDREDEAQKALQALNELVALRDKIASCDGDSCVAFLLRDIQAYVRMASAFVGGMPEEVAKPLEAALNKYLVHCPVW